MPPGIPIVTDFVDTTSPSAPPLNFTYYFDQLIDHNDPSKGTFKQRFWHNAQYYKEGGPIILMTPGEGNAAPYTGYMTNVTVTGKTAETNNGTTIILEHRFYGESNPYPDLKTASLQVHTIDQAIEDLDYFARNVVLAQDNGDKLGPDYAPWLFFGGSYSGALVSWARHKKPDLFWAGYSSSGVVEAILDFWQYWEPIRQNMPQNCSADVTTVIEYVDEVFSGDNQTAIQALKENWGLGNVSHVDDAAGALRNNLWDWQSLQPNAGYATFFQFCDQLEVKDGESAPAEGWGLEHALAAWGEFWTREDGYLSGLCGERTTEDCLGTYDPNSTFFTNTTVDNSWRSWNWIVCNDVGWLQEGVPKENGTPTIATRLVRPDYDLRQCSLMYPEAFPEPPVTNIDRVNTEYGGWEVVQPRTFFANGVRDPWRYATVSAPDSPAESKDDQPIGLSDGFHCSDLSLTRGAFDKTVSDVQNQGMDYITKWLTEWTAPEVKQKRASTSHFTPALPRHVNFTPREVPALGRTINVSGPKPVNAWFRGVGEL
jgi:hypothetical protein